MKQPDLNSVILTLYQASMTPERWPEALRLVSDFVGGCAAAMEFLHLPTGSVKVANNHGYDAQGILDVLGNDLAGFDPWWPCVDMEPDSDLHVGSKYVPAGTVRASTFYNEGLRAVGSDWCDVMAAVAPLGEDSTGLLTVYRDGARDVFSHADAARMRAVLPHIKQAFEICSRLDGYAIREQITGRISADRGDAVVFLDRNGGIVYANPLAEALVRTVPGPLIARPERMHLTDAAADKQFQAALWRCIASIDAEWEPRGETVLWQYGARRYSACLTPHLRRVLASPLAFERREPVVAVIIRDFRPDSAGIAARMRDAFRLTGAETRILEQFLDGLSPTLICERTGASMNTIKSQCRALYRKTGTANQAALVRMSFAGFGA